jgi:hypothetical protein
MAKYVVTLSLPVRVLNRADVVFDVVQEGTKFGTFTVSNGSMVWFPRGTRYGYKLGWEKFDELMKSDATRVEHRRGQK